MMILDFDHTLFQTSAFRDDLKELFLKHGVTEDDYVAAEGEAIRGAQGNYYDYTVQLHVQTLEKKGYTISKKEIVNEVDELLKNNMYVYDDTIFFLQELKKNDESIILLTAGNESFQMDKIRSINIQDYFDEIVCVRGEKEKYVESVYTPTEPIFFINDSLKENVAVKNQRDDVYVITKWNPRKNSKEELKLSEIPYFDTLTEILNHLNKYGQE